VSRRNILDAALIGGVWTVAATPGLCVAALLVNSSGLALAGICTLIVGAVVCTAAIAVERRGGRR
jgi:hypothetical protein